MSREIRFRCWDQKDKKYLLPEKQGFVILPTMPSFGATLPYENRSNPGNIDEDCVDWADEDLLMGRYELEQYTGLKDKNGNEIYEGDIVALLFGYVPMKSVTTENIRIGNAQKAVIHFDTARAAFRYTIKLRTPKDCQFKPGTKTNMVVIGNIHENPELIGGEE